MKQCGGVWLPDGETHLVDWMRRMNRVVEGKLTYQYHKLEEALKWVKGWERALDVGAHCGLWSMHLVKRFRYLHAFEPVAAHRECWEANMVAARPGIAELHPFALGEKEGSVSMVTAPTSSGDTRVAGAGEIPMHRLDSLFAGAAVDFVKIDCEGYELFVLRGGEELVKRTRPCIIVEQKPGHAEAYGLKRTEAVDYLQGLGAKLRKEVGGDFILSWD